MWKASLRLGGETLGVKLYSAATDQNVHFHLLNKKGHGRIRQRMAHPETGATVEASEVRRAIEVEPGTFVVVADVELAKFEPEPSREIRVERCVPRGSLDLRFYERPYWLGPDEGQSANYFALVDALQSAEREGIAHWTLRKRRYTGALRAERGYLALIALRDSAELLPIAKLDAPSGKRIDARELELGRQLIAALAGELEPDAFREEYRERVLELVAAKRKGKRLPARAFKPQRVDDAELFETLRLSLRKVA